MIELANLAIWSLGVIALLLVQYIALFKLYYQYKGRGLGFPIWMYLFALLFLIQDVLYNATVMALLMLDLPREWTITERMKRYKQSEKNRKAGLSGYRYQVAVHLCQILNLFDKGHC